MDVNGVSSVLSNTYSQYATSSKKSDVAADTKAADDTGVSLEISEEAKQAAESKDTAKTSDYSAIIKKMNQELDAHTQQMQNLVNELLGKQANTYQTSLAETFRKMQELADPETIEQAKKDIAEDGYWGVEQTSDRIVDMAKALSGGDPTKADKLISAVKKGLDQAKKAWGEDLPEISGKTVDAAVKKLENWRDGLDTDK